MKQLYWDENATKHTHMLCATVTDMHCLSVIQRSCCAETWTCPCRGRLNTTEVPLLLEAHDVGDAGCNRPQSLLPVDGSQLVKDGVQWHEWIPVTEP